MPSRLVQTCSGWGIKLSKVQTPLLDSGLAEEVVVHGQLQSKHHTASYQPLIAASFTGH